MQVKLTLAVLPGSCSGSRSGSPPGRVVEGRSRRRASGGVHVTGDGDVSGHLAGDPRVLRRGQVGRLQVGDGRRGPLDLTVGEVRVAELGERVVADVEHPLSQVLAARDGEVPGEVEVRAADPGTFQVGEDPLHPSPAALDLGLVGAQTVAVDAEGVLGRNPLAVGVLEVAQRDDVAMALGEVDGGEHHQGHVGGVAGVALGWIGVELREDRPALSRCGVDHDRRLIGVGVAGDVGLGYEAGLGERGRGVEPRDLEDDRGARAEAVVAVELGRVDRLLGGVAGHRQRVEVDSPAGRAARVISGVTVVGERVEALRPIEKVARLHGYVDVLRRRGLDRRPDVAGILVPAQRHLRTPPAHRTSAGSKPGERQEGPGSAVAGQPQAALGQAHADPDDAPSLHPLCDRLGQPALALLALRPGPHADLEAPRLGRPNADHGDLAPQQPLLGPRSPSSA